MQNRAIVVGKGKQTPHFQRNQSSINEDDDIATFVHSVQNFCSQHSQQNTVQIISNNHSHQPSQRPFGSSPTNNYSHHSPPIVPPKQNYSYNIPLHHIPTQQPQHPNQTSFSKRPSNQINQAQKPWPGQNSPIIVQPLKQQTHVNYQSNNFPSSTVNYQSGQITISSQDLLDLLQKLEKGNLQRFCSKLGQKIRNNANISNKLAQLTLYFKHQSQFLKKAKEIISGSLDSRIMYMVDVFLFFQQISDILNKVALRLIDIFKLQFNQNQLTGNIHQKVLKSLNLAFYKLQEVQKDNIRNLKSQSDVKRQLQKKNEQIEKLKKQVLQQKIMQIESKQLIQERFSNSLKQSQKLKIQVFELENKISAYEKKVKQMQEQKTMLRKQLYILTLDKSNMKSHIFQPSVQSEQKIRQLESVNIRLTTQNEQLKQKLKTQESFSKDNESLIVKQNNYLKNRIKSLQQTIEQHQSQFFSERINTSHRIKTLQQKIHQLQQQLSRKPLVMQHQQTYNQFLQSSYLLAYNDVQLKSNLFHLIKNFKGSKPSQFKLLYRFDKLIQSNFHHYIDNRPNLLLIIRLQNDIVIGGFSSEGLRKENQYSTGFLFSLTVNKAYHLYHGQKCLTYDQYFCVFGNSEIRLRLGQDKVYSNFGINNRFFDSGHDSYIQFLYGFSSYDYQLDRQVKIKGYEFYEVNFTL